MRRHLAVLVDAGVIIRRDSPNGKRYARKGSDGSFSQAFGFDLSPLVARAAEFEGLAEEVQAEERELRYVRERITLARRDIVKIIATGIEEGVPLPSAGQGPSTWEGVHSHLSRHRRADSAERHDREPRADRRRARPPSPTNCSRPWKATLKQ